MSRFFARFIGAPLPGRVPARAPAASSPPPSDAPPAALKPLPPNARQRAEITEKALKKKGHGHGAEWPSKIPARGWWDILKRLWSEFNDDRVLLVAAGVTFYLLLALFPALTAFVSIYGFVADPRTIGEHIAFLGGLLPSGGLDIIKTQLSSLVSQDRNALSFGFVFGFAVALWSANSGIKALFDGMNIAYEETEKRSFIRLNLVSGLFTLGAIAIACCFIVAVGVVPAVLAFLYLDKWAEFLISLARWPFLFVMVTASILLIYRFGPCRQPAKWRWLLWGACLSTVVWMLASIGFSWYLQNFANYNATYGSLGAVIGFMVWTWISVAILLVGAELNAEMERQVLPDSTTGPDAPLGQRGATVADMVAG